MESSSLDLKGSFDWNAGSGADRKEGIVRARFAVLFLVAAAFAATALGAWTDEVRISTNSDSNETYLTNGHKVVFGSDGVGHVVWWGSKTGNRVYYARYYPGSGWTGQLVLSTSGSNPSIALDADGKSIHVAWWGYKKVGKCSYHVFYQKCVPTSSGTGGWVGSPVDICQTHTNDRYHQYPALACPPAPNSVVVTWQEQVGSSVWGDAAIGFRACASGTWSNQLQLDGPSTLPRILPSISVAPNGNVFVGYYGKQSAAQAYFHVYVKSRVGSSWQQTEDATPTATSVNYYYLDIDANPQTGNPHIVCHSCLDSGGRLWRIYHNYRKAGLWLTPRLVYDPGPGDTNRIDCQPSLTFTPEGKAYVAWSDYDRVDSGNWRGLLYSVCPAEGGFWGAPAQVSTSSSRAFAPSLAIAPVGAYAVWTDEVLSAPWQVWGKGLPFSTLNGLESEPTRTDRLNVALLPTPAKGGLVSVQYSLPRAEPLQVTLLDVSGRAVRTEQVSANSRTGALSIDLSGLNAGVYLVRITGADLTMSRKLVVQR